MLRLGYPLHRHDSTVKRDVSIGREKRKIDLTCLMSLHRIFHSIIPTLQLPIML